MTPTTATTSDRRDVSSTPQQAPKGWRRLLWLGPGFLWMVSAAGSGELLFTPRMGALYGYSLLWALITAVVFKWVINREVGRYTVATGETVLEGMRRIPGPNNWAIWLILLPQLVVAVATIAGLAGSAASALILTLPGDIRIWMILAVLASTALVAWGEYQGIERVAMAIAIALGVASVVAALTALTDPSPLLVGLAPRVPADIDFGEVLPWLGFMLSGTAGMIWYSYWLRSKGYGGATSSPTETSSHSEADLDRTAREQLRGWLQMMTLDNSVAVIGTLIITGAFLILGTELLMPRGLVPAEDEIASVLGRLLGELWGPIGFWFMVTAVFIGFWDTVLSDQDGFGRMFANGLTLLPGFKQLLTNHSDIRVRRWLVLTLLTAIPIGVYLLVGRPVGLLALAGAIEAAQIPVLAGLVIWMNDRLLSPSIRPTWYEQAATIVAGGFFALFAAFFLWQLIGSAA